MFNILKLLIRRRYFEILCAIDLIMRIRLYLMFAFDFDYNQLYISFNKGGSYCVEIYTQMA